MGLIGAFLIGVIAVILIEYVDWSRLMGGNKPKDNKPKEKRKSKIRWDVVGWIIFLICIAIVASLT